MQFINVIGLHIVLEQVTSNQSNTSVGTFKELRDRVLHLTPSKNYS